MTFAKKLIYAAFQGALAAVTIENARSARRPQAYSIEDSTGNGLVAALALKCVQGDGISNLAKISGRP
jgi:hypothetical protein